MNKQILNKMLPIAKEAINKIPNIGKTNMKLLKNTKVHAIYILPFKSFWTYYLTELDIESGIAFGLVAGDFVEWGEFDLKELYSMGFQYYEHIQMPKTFEELKNIELKKTLTKEELSINLNMTFD